MGGLHSVHQQFQFRQLKQPGTDEVAVLRAFDADDVQAEVHEQLDIALHIFPGGLDAMSLDVYKRQASAWLLSKATPPSAWRAV